MSPEQNLLEAHTALLQKLPPIIPHIVPQDLELVSPIPWHPDFRAGNIYIED